MLKPHMFRCFGVVAVAGALSAQPVLDRIEPRGAQIGTSVRLALSGTGLGPSPRLLADGLFAATPLTGSPGDEKMEDGRLEYLVELPADARPGVYAIRLETAEGISNALLFAVGEFPQAVELESMPDPEAPEKPNDFPETAQAIRIPTTIEGRLDGAERDIFWFQAAKGQTLVAEVAARRVGSAIDPSIELLDADGSVLFRNGDSAGLGLDARLSFEVPEDGRYHVAVQDARFSEQDENFYRLTVGEYPFADNVFPLGWQRGATVRAEFFGGNLDEPLRGEIDLGRVPGNAEETWVRVPGTPSYLPFIVGESEEALESAGSRALREGVVMNGRIAADGEVDSYSLSVNPGDQWAFELHSGELRGSSLYGVMTVASEGETLAVAGKYAGDPNPYIITTTGQTATFPFVNLTVPPEATQLTVNVEDLLGRGGRDFSYRLVARRQGPDFLLTVNEPFLNIPRGGSTILTVTAERRGYYGPIELYIENLPDDIEVSGGQIAPTSTLNNTLPRFEVGRLTLTPSPDAEMRRLNLIVRGRAVEEGKEHLDHRATGPGIRVQVKGEGQPAVTAEWLGFDLPARVNPEQPATLEFETPRRQRLVRGAQGLIARWTFRARQPGARLKQKLKLPRNAASLRLRETGEGDGMESGGFRMFTHERSSLGMVNFNLSATVSSGGKDHAIRSRSLEVDVVDGYGLEPPHGPLGIAAGARGTLTGSIWRDPLFQRTVTVSVIGLPTGVQCREAEIASDETSFELDCEAAGTVASGDYDVELRAESMLSDEGTTRYLVDPVEATVTVE